MIDLLVSPWVLWPVATALVISFVGSFLRRLRNDKDRTRRESERNKWAETKRKQRESMLLSRLKRHFPFLDDEVFRGYTSDSEPLEVLKKAILATPGTLLGTSTNGVPVLLPFTYRNRHVAMFGRSGSGKTSLIMQLVRDDLINGRGLIVLAAEAEVARDLVLPEIPFERAKDLIYFAPAHSGHAWNFLEIEAGEDADRCAAELYYVLREGLGEGSIGPRSDAIARHLFAAVSHHPSSTFLDVRRFLLDPSFRELALSSVQDEQTLAFWKTSFPRYPENAVLPLLQRIERLTAPNVRRALCSPKSTFTLNDAISASKILILDVSGLDPDLSALVGQLCLARLRLAFMRREAVPESERPFTALYVDEAHLWGGSADSWQQLASRCRRYNVGLVTATQYPAQLPLETRRAILGNSSTIVSFAVSAENAAAIRSELVVASSNRSHETTRVAADTLVSLPVGSGYVRVGTGALALRVRFLPPLERKPVERGENIKQLAGNRHAETQGVRSQNPAGDLRAVATPPAEAVSTQALAGRGSQQHKDLQHLVRAAAERRGFQALVEHEILGGACRIDVALIRSDMRLAVEVAITSSLAQVTATVSRCLAAGFKPVVVLTSDTNRCTSIASHLAGQIVAKDRSHVQVLDADGVLALLDGMPEASPGPSNNGFELVVEFRPVSGGAPYDRRHAIAELVATALRRTSPTP